MDKRIKAFIDSGDMVREYGKDTAVLLVGSYLSDAIGYGVDLTYWDSLLEYCKKYDSNCNLYKRIVV